FWNAVCQILKMLKIYWPSKRIFAAALVGIPPSITDLTKLWTTHLPNLLTPHSINSPTLRFLNFFNPRAEHTILQCNRQTLAFTHSPNLTNGLPRSICDDRKAT